MKDALNKAIVIGGQVASVKAPSINQGYENPSLKLELHQASSVDDGAFYPAESFSVYGRPQLAALRDLIIEALEYTEAEPKPEQKPLEVDKEAFLKP